MIHRNQEATTSLMRTLSLVFLIPNIECGKDQDVRQDIAGTDMVFLFGRLRTSTILLLLTIYCFCLANRASGDDRSFFCFPMSASQSFAKNDTHNSGPSFADHTILAWAQYMQLWKAHAELPSNPAIRRFLSLPLDGTLSIKTSRGRSAPSWLGWRRGTYTQIESPHFVIYSRAGSKEAKEIAEDLQRCYWVWTQMFFPLWNCRNQVTIGLSKLEKDLPNSAQVVADCMSQSRSRLVFREKMRVVLFRGRADYVASLKSDVPGIEQSTGFYSDENRTTFLFASDKDASTETVDELQSTRRHELCHQLFIEATQRLRDRNSSTKRPGETADFWLIEGIAGYFESLSFNNSKATLGGWDSPRLQFSRYRTFVSGDTMPLSELRPDGRVTAQQRADLARWYAMAITYVHTMLDSGNIEWRRWVYNRLANLYGCPAPFPDTEEPDVKPRDVQKFLSIDDDHLHQNAATRQMLRLCLAGCEVTSDGLSRIESIHPLFWLDLSRLPVDSKDIERLVSDPRQLTQLSLEATKIDNQLSTLLQQATNLRELDLSFTAISDETAKRLRRHMSLEVLWLTGTKITDESLGVISALPNLNSIDIQRTGVSTDAIKLFRSSRPEVNVNPLELR